MSSMDESARHRRRVTFGQLEVLWEYLNSHRDVATGFNKSAQAREHSKRLWQSVAEALNSHEEGAFKDWKRWSNYWVDYKAKLKRRVSAVQQSQSRTEGPSNITPLYEIERKFLSLLGENFGAGISNVQVDPFENSSTSTTVKTELVVLPSSGSASPNIDLQETPQLAEVEVEPLEEYLSEAPPAQDAEAAPTFRPVRRRRPRQSHITQQAARSTLVKIAQSTLKLEKKQTEAMQKQTEILELMLHTLNKIADAVNK